MRVDPEANAKKGQSPGKEEGEGAKADWISAEFLPLRRERGEQHIVEEISQRRESLLL